MAIRRLQLGRNARWVSLVVFLLAITPAVAQVPDKFTNLQVLPKDISKNDLQATMRSFAFALNVRCPYCHAQKADTTMDFPSDDKDTKKTARVMLQMLAAINRDYVSKIGKPAPVQVECATCHRGLTQPRLLNAVLAETIEKQGIDGAVKQYHDLRSQYYGTGQYDFGETPLNQLTESLLAKEKNREAVAIYGDELCRQRSNFRLVVSHACHVAPGERRDRESQSGLQQGVRTPSRRQLGEATDRRAVFAQIGIRIQPTLSRLEQLSDNAVG